MANRLTSSMRKFTNLDIKRDFNAEMKTQVRITAGKKYLSWTDLRNSIKSDIQPCEWKTVENLMSQLWSLAKDLHGSEVSIEVINDTSVYLMRHFLDHKIAMVKHLTEMRKVFPTATNFQAKKGCLLVFELSAYLSEDVRAKLNEEVSPPKDVKKIFKLPYDIHVPEYAVQHDVSVLADMRPILCGAASLAAQRFTLKLKRKMKKPELELPEYNLMWLQKHVNADLLISAVRLIESRMSNDELQGELLDIMGFDKLEELQQILAHRNELILDFKLKGTSGKGKGRKNQRIFSSFDR